MDEATAPEPYDLLLALAGRVDDDMLGWARELIAVGESPAAVELLTASLIADRTVLPEPVRAALVAAGRAARIDLDADALPPPGPEAGLDHRFEPEPPAVADVAAAVGELPARHLRGCRVQLTWRLTPAGSASGPLPHPVVLVEVEPGERPRDVLAYQLAVALERVGVHAAVEVLAAGDPVPPYHAAALRGARPVRTQQAGAHSAAPHSAAPHSAGAHSAGAHTEGADPARTDEPRHLRSGAAVVPVRDIEPLTPLAEIQHPAQEWLTGERDRQGGRPVSASALKPPPRRPAPHPTDPSEVSASRSAPEGGPPSGPPPIDFEPPASRPPDSQLDPAPLDSGPLDSAPTARQAPPQPVPRQLPVAAPPSAAQPTSPQPPAAPPTSPEPTGPPPTVAPLGAAGPPTAEPNAAQEPNARPHAVQSPTAQSPTAQSHAGQSPSAQHTAPQPTAPQPTARQAPTAQSHAARPPTAQHTAPQPTARESTAKPAAVPTAPPSSTLQPTAADAVVAESSAHQTASAQTLAAQSPIARPPVGMPAAAPAPDGLGSDPGTGLVPPLPDPSNGTSAATPTDPPAVATTASGDAEDATTPPPSPVRSVLDASPRRRRPRPIAAVDVEPPSRPVPSPTAHPGPTVPPTSRATVPSPVPYARGGDRPATTMPAASTIEPIAEVPAAGPAVADTTEDPAEQGRQPAFVLASTHAVQHDALSGPLDGPLLAPLLDPTVHENDPLGIGPRPAVEDSWASEWAAGTWAMAPSAIGGKSSPASPPAEPIAGATEGDPPAPVPTSQRAARHRFADEADDVDAVPEPAVVDDQPPQLPTGQSAETAAPSRSESMSRLSDADRRLLARLQAELANGPVSRQAGAANGAVAPNGVSDAQPNGTRGPDEPPGLAG